MKLPSTPDNKRAIESCDYQINELKSLENPGPVIVPGMVRPEAKERDKALERLRKVQDIPKLPNKRQLTATDVDRWIRDIKEVLQIANCPYEDIVRTRWIIRTVDHVTYRDILRAEVDEETIRTWSDIQAKVHQLTEDPLLAKYDRYYSFWNTEYRPADGWTGFVNQMMKAQTRLDFDPFGLRTLQDVDKARISWAWSKLSDFMRKEIKRCWKYRVMRSQRRYLEGLIDDIDDADDEY